MLRAKASAPPPSQPQGDADSNAPLPLVLTRFHRARLLQIWRSAGWPCKDGLEIDLLAAGLIRLHAEPGSWEALRLTDAGIRTLAVARQRAVRALSLHDRLSQKFADQLLLSGRVVWAELSLRAQVEGGDAAQMQEPQSVNIPASALSATSPEPATEAVNAMGARRDLAQPAPLWPDDEGTAAAAAPNAAAVWRMARPDLFSVRNTTVPHYLQPMVHEVKASRADLLSDLRHAAKRQAYQWLCEECYYVFPAGVAQPEEIPPEFGIWVLHGEVDSGYFELLRPARHQPCTLPFAVWMALSKSTPLRRSEGPRQARLGDEDAPLPELDEPAKPSELPGSSCAAAPTGTLADSVHRPNIAPVPPPP